MLLVAVVLTAAPASALVREDNPGDPGSTSVRAVVPTSVLLLAPGTGASAALHALDRAYAELSALVRPDRDAIPSMRPPEGRRVGPTVTVNWMLRDSEVWRVDRIYYEAAGGPWIATDLRIDGVDSDSQTEWHTSSDADRLVQILADLGVIGPASESPASESPASESPASASSLSAGQAPATSDTEQPADGRWPWAVGGLLVGVALTLGALRLAGWRRDPDREPRQQLIDL